MTNENAPILEFDDDREAIIQPSKMIKEQDLPECCVLTLFTGVIETAGAYTDFESLAPFSSEMGKMPVYKTTYQGKEIAASHCSVGASLAAAQLEELIARGARKFFVSGKAGVLDNRIASGHVVVPIHAVRDEGTSYHYLPPSREVAASSRMVETLKSVLDEHECPYVEGKTWTTDGFYRETRRRIAKRIAEGCITVEMEAAALFAVAAFRKVELGMLLCGGDDVTGTAWDPRDYSGTATARDLLFKLSLEACAKR